MELSKMFGVELDADFEVEGYVPMFKVILDGRNVECLMFKWTGISEWQMVDSRTLCAIIHAAPAGIIHLPPPLTDDQREQLRAIWTLGGRWIAKDETGDVFAYVSKPRKIMICSNWDNGGYGECFTVMRELSVCTFVSWSDPEPYDIGKALGVGEC